MRNREKYSDFLHKRNKDQKCLHKFLKGRRTLENAEITSILTFVT